MIILKKPGPNAHAWLFSQVIFPLRYLLYN